MNTIILITIAIYIVLTILNVIFVLDTQEWDDLKWAPRIVWLILSPFTVCTSLTYSLKTWSLDLKTRSVAYYDLNVKNGEKIGYETYKDIGIVNNYIIKNITTESFTELVDLIKALIQEGYAWSRQRGGITYFTFDYSKLEEITDYVKASGI